MPKIKLTPEAVAAIRQRWKAGNVMQKVIAIEFNTSTSHVCMILSGKRRKHP